MARSRVSLAASVGWAGLVVALGGSAPWRRGADVLAYRISARAAAEEDAERRRTAPNSGGNSREEAFRFVMPIHRPCHCLFLIKKKKMSLPVPVTAFTLDEGFKFTAKPHLKNQGSRSVILFLRRGM